MAMLPAPLVFHTLPVKATSKVDFEARVKATGAKAHTPTCSRASRTRDDFCEQISMLGKSPELPLQRARDALEAYLGCLAGFLHVPADRTTESKLRSLVPFHWGPCVAAPHKFILADSLFEAANAVCNFGLCCLNQASRLVRSSSNREQVEKDAYALCTEAAGWFQLAAQLLERVPRPTGYPADATPEFMVALRALALGQAQELGFRRALEKENDAAAGGSGANFALLTKLVHQSVALYEEAVTALRKEPAASDKFTELFRYAQLKAQVTRVYLHLCMALYCNKKDDNGAAMLCAEHAAKLGASAVSDGKALGSGGAGKELLDLCTAAHREAEAKVVKFQKENELVYHQRKAEVLPDPLPGQVLARAKALDLPPPSKDWDGSAYDDFVVPSPAPQGPPGPPFPPAPGPAAPQSPFQGGPGGPVPPGYPFPTGPLPSWPPSQQYPGVASPPPWRSPPPPPAPYPPQAPPPYGPGQYLPPPGLAPSPAAHASGAAPAPVPGPLYPNVPASFASGPNRFPGSSDGSFPLRPAPGHP